MGAGMAASSEKLAMGLVREFFEKNGWNVEDVSRKSGEHAGYDFLLTKDSKRLRIEVKGSSKPYRGIPDLYGTSVDKEKRLVAEFLCVGYFPENGPKKLAIIPRNDIPSDGLVPKSSYCIKNEYKSLEKISKRLVDLDEPCPDYVTKSSLE
jgi:hypothetical protein